MFILWFWMEICWIQLRYIHIPRYPCQDEESLWNSTLSISRMFVLHTYLFDNNDNDSHSHSNNDNENVLTAGDWVIPSLDNDVPCGRHGLSSYLTSAAVISKPKIGLVQLVVYKPLGSSQPHDMICFMTEPSNARCNDRIVAYVAKEKITTSVYNIMTIISESFSRTRTIRKPNS